MELSELVNNQNKKCSACKSLKPVTDFSKNKTHKDGLHNQCKSCKRVSDKAYYTANQEQIKSTVKTYKQTEAGKASQKTYQQTEAGKASRKVSQKKYAQANQDKIAKRMKIYQQVNPGKMCALKAKRRAAKLQATPPWLTKEDLELIELHYLVVQVAKAQGVAMHVDHIVPLQGKNVCGLHVPWNLQVIRAKDNLSKSNKF